MTNQATSRNHLDASHGGIGDGVAVAAGAPAARAPPDWGTRANRNLARDADVPLQRPGPREPRRRRAFRRLAAPPVRRRPALKPTGTTPWLGVTGSSCEPARQGRSSPLHALKIHWRSISTRKERRRIVPLFSTFFHHSR